MVAYSAVQASNALIASELPEKLVAVFVGATSGIGEYTLKAFAKHVKQPRIYFVGRSQEAADRITEELKALNADGEYVFMKSDVSLIRNVDSVCEEIKRKEKAINVLCLSQGTLYSTNVTDEGLNTPIALAYYSRIRFMTNLLPLVQAATSLRRILSIFAGGKEGPINMNDIPLNGYINPLTARGHPASMMTLTMERLAEKAPSVSFIHDFPGPVKSNIARERNMVNFVLGGLFALLGPFIYMANEESGERHLFLQTSAMYPAAEEEQGDAAGVGLQDGMGVAKGTNGKVGSGVYAPDAQGEPAGQATEKLLAQVRSEGVPEKLWEHTEAEFGRIASGASK